MGMNGMSMGMGFDGGQGTYGAWNGSNQMWNGQDNNNPNAFMQGMGGDFGPNSGYGGYNMQQQQQQSHGNYNQMHAHQKFPNHYQHGFQNQGYGRGRGRGRGFGYSARGRGGYGMSMQGNQGDYEAFSHQLPSNVHSNGSIENPASATGAREQFDHNQGASSANADPSYDISKELNPGGDNDEEEQFGFAKKDMTEAEKPETSLEVHGSLEPTAEPNRSIEQQQAASISETSKSQEQAQSLNGTADLQPISSVVSEPLAPKAPPAAPLGPSSHFQSPRALDSSGKVAGLSIRGGFRGRGGPGFLSNGDGNHISPTQTSPTSTFPIVPIEPKGVGVVGAPTGPKALRQGTSIPSGRGRGFSIVGRASISSATSGPRAEVPARDRR